MAPTVPSRCRSVLTATLAISGLAAVASRCSTTKAYAKVCSNSLGSFADAAFALTLAGLVAGLLNPDDDNRSDRRWRLALLGMDDLGLDLEGKRAVLRRARDAT